METFVNSTVRIRLFTDLDVSGYTTLLIKYRKPDRTVGCWDATLDPADNEYIYYNTVIGDLDQAGTWLLQAAAEDVGVLLHGLWAKLEVHDPITATCPPTTVAPTTPGP